MCVQSSLVGVVDHIFYPEFDELLFSKEAGHLVDEPGEHTLMQSFVSLVHNDSLVNQAAKGCILESHQVLLGHNSGHMLLVRLLALFLARFLLDLAPVQLLLPSRFSRF